MAADIATLRTMLAVKKRTQDAVFVFLTGDADFCDCIKDTLKLGIQVVVASWEHALASKIPKLNPPPVIMYLNDGLQQIGGHEHRAPNVDGLGEDNTVLIADLSFEDLTQELNARRVAWFLVN